MTGREDLFQSRPPIRVAYADPPYPGQAKRHYGKDGDPFEGDVAEVDHAELIEGLERDYPDGWALSTSVPALGDLLALCPQPSPSKKRTWNGRGGVKLGTGVRVGAWIRSAGNPFPPSRVMWTWEPVIFRIPHWRQRHSRDFVRDSITASQPHGFLGNTITGQKPEAFCYWIFEVLGLTPEDDLVDVWWDDHGVYLAAIERPYGPSRIAQAALYRTLGAVIACIPSRLPLWEVSPQEWRAGIGVAARASKDEVREAVVKIMCPTVDMLARGIGGGPRTYEWRDWPQDAHDAFAVAYTARAKNTAAIAQSAA